MPFLAGVTQAIKSLPDGPTLQSTEGRGTARGTSEPQLCHCCESLPGTACSPGLGTLKALSVSKLGVKGTLFGGGSERIWV